MSRYRNEAQVLSFVCLARNISQLASVHIPAE
jgi:hypothetical protein